MATAAELQIILKGKDKASGAINGITGNTKNMTEGFKKAGTAMTVAGGLITTGLGLMVKDFVSAGDEVQKMALRTGISTESLSELKYAADLSGTSLASIEKGVKKMSTVLFDAEEEVLKFDQRLNEQVGTVSIAKEALEKLEKGNREYEIALKGVNKEQEALQKLEKGSEEYEKALKTVNEKQKALKKLEKGSKEYEKAQIQLNKAEEKESEMRAAAKAGIGTYDRALKLLGVSTAELTKLSPEQQFDRLAMAVADVEDPFRRSALAQDIFGKAGTELLPLFAQGAEGIERMREKARELGIVFDQDAADAAAELSDAMTTLKGTFDGVKIAIAKELVPILTPFIERVQEVIGTVREWIEKNPELSNKIVIATAAIGGLLAILGPLLIMLPGIIAGAGLLGTAFGVLLGPIGLVVAAIAGLIAVGVLVWKNWDWIGAFFKKLWDNIYHFFADNWQLILLVIAPFIGLPLLIMKNWETIKDFFRNLWEDVIGFFRDGVNDMITLVNKIPGVKIPLIKGTSQGQFIEAIRPADYGTSGTSSFIKNSTPGNGAGVIINNNIAGSVLTESELTEITRDGLFSIADRNTTTGIL
tara:strand:- start:5985 stop:7748 length:1764 start_codon:yes stop_codon:yes gene_type:complete